MLTASLRPFTQILLRRHSAAFASYSGFKGDNLKIKETGGFRSYTDGKKTGGDELLGGQEIDGYKTCLQVNKLEKINFRSFIGKDVFKMSNLIYLATMSDGWKMIDICDKKTPLYQAIDGLHCEGCKSPVSRHMACTGTHVQSVRVLELGYEDRDIKQRMKELVSNWPTDDLLNVMDNPHAPNSNLKEIYLKARAKTPLNGLNEY